MVSEHVFHRQRLDAHRLVLTDDAGREFVLKITPLVSDPSMQSGYLLTRLDAVLAALGLARELALGGVFGAPFKEVREGRLQVAQALLQGNSRDIGQPGGFWLLFEEGQQRGEILI